MDALNNPKKPNENNLHMNTLFKRIEIYIQYCKKTQLFAYFSAFNNTLT